jgi:hypothetical protein
MKATGGKQYTRGLAEAKTRACYTWRGLRRLNGEQAS